MKVFGQLEAAQLENLAADPTGLGLVEGREWLNTATNEHKVYINSVVRVVASTATAQTLSNKTLSNPALAGYADIDQIATPANPAAATLRIYQKSDGKLYTLDNAGSELPLGSGSGSGGINYIPEDSRDIEATIGSFATDDGVGGASGILSLAVTTTVGEFLRGTASLKITKSASDGSSHFVKIATNTIDPADYNGSMYFTAEIKPLTGYAADDLVLEFYDVTNAAVLSSQGITSISAAEGRIRAVTFLADDTASVEVRIKVNNATANSYDVSMDAFQFGPSTLVDAPIVSDVTSFTPTGTWTTNTTYTGQYKRVGDIMHGEALVTVTGAPTSATLFLDVPLGLTIDTAKISSGTTEDLLRGRAFIHDDSAGPVHSGGVSYETTTTLRVTYLTTDGISEVNNWSSVTEAAPFTFASGDNVRIKFEIPIVEWANQSAIISTSEAMNLVAKARYSTNAGLSIPTGAGAIVDFGNQTFDDLGLVTTGASWVFTARKTGTLNVSAYIRFANSQSWGSGTNVNLIIEKNGSQFTATDSLIDAAVTPGQGPSVQTTTLVAVVAGDTIAVRAQHGEGSARSLIAFDALNWINIHELPDFSVYGIHGETLVVEDVNAEVGYPMAADTVGDLGSIVLDPGEYDLRLQAVHRASGALTTDNLFLGLGTASGTGTTGLVLGDTQVVSLANTASGDHTSMSLTVTGLVIAATTTMYMKGLAETSITNLNVSSKISARKIK